MNKYMIMPEHCKWMEVEAKTHEMAYRGICSWFNYDRRIAVMDMNTKVTKVFRMKSGGIKIIDDYIEEI